MRENSSLATFDNTTLADLLTFVHAHLDICSNAVNPQDRFYHMATALTYLALGALLRDNIEYLRIYYTAVSYTHLVYKRQYISRTFCQISIKRNVYVIPFTVQTYLIPCMCNSLLLCISYYYSSIDVYKRQHYGDILPIFLSSDP